ncbi:MAG: glutathione S-transferase family protein [Sphingomonas sp.]|nr:glutathione S-transferase family protein [Sphingomonas sp.]RZV48571.1 MAG: glutathione S-transferase family protein [Sphingomonadaceae bacterium]
MALTFYTNPMSRGQIARWALHEAGVDYDQKIISYGEEMKSEPYLSINPMGKVPAIDHDGTVVTECAAICHYLAEMFKPDLLPKDAEKAAYFRWMFYAAGPVEAAVTNKSMGFEVTEPDKKGMLGYGDYDLVMDVLEKHFAANDYVVGDRFTMADVYLGSHVSWGLQFGTMPERGSFKAYAERLTARDAWKAAKAIDVDLIAKAQAK